MWLARQPGFELIQMWWLSVATVALQLVIVLWFVKREMDQRLATMEGPGTQPEPAV